MLCVMPLRAQRSQAERALKYTYPKPNRGLARSLPDARLRENAQHGSSIWGSGVTLQPDRYPLRPPSVVRRAGCLPALAPSFA